MQNWDTRNFFYFRKDNVYTLSTMNRYNPPSSLINTGQDMSKHFKLLYEARPPFKRTIKANFSNILRLWNVSFKIA